MTKLGGLGTLNFLHQVFGMQYKGEYFDEIYTYIVSIGNELFPNCTELCITSISALPANFHQ